MILVAPEFHEFVRGITCSFINNVYAQHVWEEGRKRDLASDFRKHLEEKNFYLPPPPNPSNRFTPDQAYPSGTFLYNQNNNNAAFFQTTTIIGLIRIVLSFSSPSRPRGGQSRRSNRVAHVPWSRSSRNERLLEEKSALRRDVEDWYQAIFFNLMDQQYHDDVQGRFEDARRHPKRWEETPLEDDPTSPQLGGSGFGVDGGALSPRSARSRAQSSDYGGSSNGGSIQDVELQQTTSSDPNGGGTERRNYAAQYVMSSPYGSSLGRNPLSEAPSRNPSISPMSMGQSRNPSAGGPMSIPESFDGLGPGSIQSGSRYQQSESGRASAAGSWRQGGQAPPAIRRAPLARKPLNSAEAGPSSTYRTRPGQYDPNQQAGPSNSYHIPYSSRNNGMDLLQTRPTIPSASTTPPPTPPDVKAVPKY
jgi:hypothetical protein